MNAVFKNESARQLVLERYRALLASWPVDHEQHILPTRQGDTFALAWGRRMRPR
jgi:hypothetical protein